VYYKVTGGDDMSNERILFCAASLFIMLYIVILIPFTENGFRFLRYCLVTFITLDWVLVMAITNNRVTKEKENENTNK